MVHVGDPDPYQNLTDPPERGSFCYRRTLLHLKISASSIYQFPLPLNNSPQSPPNGVKVRSQTCSYVLILSLDEWMWRGDCGGGHNATNISPSEPEQYDNRKEAGSSSHFLVFMTVPVMKTRIETRGTGRCCIIETVNNIYKGVVAEVSEKRTLVHLISRLFPVLIMTLIWPLSLPPKQVFLLVSLKFTSKQGDS